jgi:hypothetical protein
MIQSARGGAIGGVGSRGAASDDAVVVTLTLTWAGLVPSSVTEAGDTVHVAFDGAPVHANDTAWLKPPWGESTRSKLAVAPAAVVRLVVRAVRAKS